MKASSVLALAGLAAATPLTVQVNDNAPDPSQVRIRSVGYAGTGCPQGSAYTSISENARTVTVLFDSYVATVGAGAAPSAQRRACTLQIELTYPSGYSFNVLTVRTQGYVNTDPGVTGQVVNKYFFSGVPGIATSTTNIPGNTHGNWAKTDSLNAAASVYAPCGGDGVVNMQTSVALQQQVAGANGYISADSIDASFQQKFRQDYGLGWDTSRCNNGGNTQPAGPIPADPYAGNSPAPFPAPVPVAAPAPVYNPNPYQAQPQPFNPYNPYQSNPYQFGSSSPFGGSPYGGSPFGGSPFGGFPFSGYQATTTSGITAPLTASSDD